MVNSDFLETNNNGVDWKLWQVEQSNLGPFSDPCSSIFLFKILKTHWKTRKCSAEFRTKRKVWDVTSWLEMYVIITHVSSPVFAGPRTHSFFHPPEISKQICRDVPPAFCETAGPRLPNATREPPLNATRLSRTSNGTAIIVRRVAKQCFLKLCYTSIYTSCD